MYDEERVSVAVEHKDCLAHVIYRDLTFTPLKRYRHRSYMGILNGRRWL